MALGAILWTIGAFFVLGQYDPAHRKLDPDASFMLYAGQQILRGHAPYVGVTIVKLPGAPLLAATSIAAGRAFGWEDVFAGRVAFWLCASVSVGALFLLGAQLFPETTRADEKMLRLVFGSFAAALLLSFQTYGIQVAEGPEAKLPMVCAGLLALLFLARQKFFWAGLAGALSFLAWQPGLIFVLVAFLAAWFVPNRKHALRDLLGGVALPLVLVGIYLAWNGALASMFRQTFGANINFLGERKVAVGLGNVIVENFSKVWAVSTECSPTELPFIYLGYVGMIGGAAFLLYHFWKTRAKNFFYISLPTLLSGGTLFAFSLLDLQKCSDLVPLLPFLALGGAFLLAIPIWFSATKNARVGLALGSLLLLSVLVYGTFDAFRLPAQRGLEQQRAVANEIAAFLQTDDGVQQFGDTVFLVLTRRENVTRFVHLGEKQGIGILTAEGMTIETLIQQLQAAQPRVITVSRAKKKTWAQPLYDWIEQEYTRQTSYTGSEGGTQNQTVVWLKKE